MIRYNDTVFLLQKKQHELELSMAAVALNAAMSAPPQRETAINLPQDEMEVDNIVTEQSADDITPNIQDNQLPPPPGMWENP